MFVIIRRNKIRKITCSAGYYCMTNKKTFDYGGFGFIGIYLDYDNKRFYYKIDGDVLSYFLIKKSKSPGEDNSNNVCYYSLKHTNDVFLLQPTLITFNRMWKNKSL